MSATLKKFDFIFCANTKILREPSSAQKLSRKRFQCIERHQKLNENKMNIIRLCSYTESLSQDGMSCVPCNKNRYTTSLVTSCAICPKYKTYSSNLDQAAVAESLRPLEAFNTPLNGLKPLLVNNQKQPQF